jgi:hypothetical protein
MGYSKMDNLQTLKNKADRLAQSKNDDYFVVIGDDGMEVVSGYDLENFYWFITNNDILYCAYCD